MRFFQDQLNIAGDLNAQNMFRIDQERHAVHVANGLFQLQFHAPESPLKASCSVILLIRGKKQKH